LEFSILARISAHASVRPPFRSDSDGIGERSLSPVTRGIGVYDGGEAVTDVKTARFESASGSLDEGKHRVTLTWKDGIYHKKKPYRLVLTEAETGVEHQSVGVVIDRRSLMTSEGPTMEVLTISSIGTS
jgi:hypothetical protein